MTAQPLSLYLDLEPGEVADIEVVARTALAFSAAIKELVYISDPGLDVRVELASSTAGSLSLNAVIRSLKARAEERPILAAVAATSLLWFGNYAFNEVIDHIRGKDELSDEDVQRIADRVTANLAGRVAQPQVQKVYQELERDKRIKGVGATVVAGERPKSIVPREEFARRADPAIITNVTTETRRSRKRRERVLIVRPVLVPGMRRWRFNSAEGEFGALIKDEDFVANLLAGRIRLPMIGGVELDVLLETEEELQDGVWMPKEWTVWEVYGPHYQPLQGGLFPPDGPDE